MKWWAVHTNARAEHVAAEKLRAEGIEVFAPWYMATVRSGRKTGVVKRSYFSRYIFARCDPQMIGRINRAQGVSTVVSFGSEPLAIPDDVMQAIIDLAGEGARMDVPSEANPSPYSVGETVRVSMGPFAAQLAQVAEIDKKGRIRVWLHALGGKRPAQVAAARVSKIKAP